MSNFKFELGAEVTISVSGEHGIVVGRAEYPDSPNIYLVLYKSSEGRAVEGWWKENVLE